MPKAFYKEKKEMKFLFKDNPSLEFHTVWDYFRSENNKLYMLVNRIVETIDNKEYIIGYIGEERKRNGAIMKIHDIKIKLPKEYKSVLLFNKENNEWVIGYIIKGISKVERNELSDDNERKRSFQFGDECDNNLVPYEFKGDGPMSYFGQYITHWCKLPNKIKG